MSSPAILGGVYAFALSVHSDVLLVEVSFGLLA